MNATLKLVLAMGIFGTIGVFRQFCPLPSGLLAFSRGLIGMLCLLLMLRLRGKKPDRAAIRRQWVPLCLSGAVMGVNWMLLFESYNFVGVGTATLCYYFAPMFIVLGAPCFLGERLTARKLLCVAVALVGMIFVSGVLQEGAVEKSGRLGVLLAVGAAVLYATVVLLNKRLDEIGAYDRTIVQLGAAAVVMIPYVAFSMGAEAVAFTGRSALLLLVMGVVHTGVAYALYFGSLKDMKAQSAAILSYIDPVVALVLSTVFLGERLTAWTVLGAVLILGAAVVSELPARGKARGAANGE